MQATWGDRVGLGVLEQIVIGPHHARGLTGLTDGFAGWASPRARRAGRDRRTPRRGGHRSARPRPSAWPSSMLGRRRRPGRRRRARAGTARGRRSERIGDVADAADVDGVGGDRRVGTGTAIHCVPAHGSSSRSGKIQRLAASATASIVARPTARWSAQFHARRPRRPSARRGTGRRRRRAAGGGSPRRCRGAGRGPRRRARRGGRGTRSPTRRRSAPLARSSASRAARASSGASESMPASPDVTST